MLCGHAFVELAPFLLQQLRISIEYSYVSEGFTDHSSHSIG